MYAVYARQILSTLLLVSLYALAHGTDGKDECERKQLFSAAMLGDNREPAGDPNALRVWEHITRFPREVFEGVEGAPQEMKYWPPIWSLPCTGDSRQFDKGRGSNLAHREAWDAFYRHGRSCGEEQRDMLMIFEYDVFQGIPGAGQLAIDALRNTTADLYFMGYCFHEKRDGMPWESGRAPWCLHAYAVTMKGAKQLVEMVDVCGPYADAQLANLADAKKIQWDYDRRSFDRAYVDKKFGHDGVHLSGFFSYGGVFVQAKFDADMSHLPEGTLSHLKHGRQLYVLRELSWRPIRHMDELNALGLDVGRAVSLSDWQFGQFKLGAINS
ncbi:hypothetical protein B484DRAFT_467601 [Ochromonadaceae sp. CCMP2298]|nr:hypothetical protein B484DRAFT_467601 [Ochromonadaceae sp. CCMP2298]